MGDTESDNTTLWRQVAVVVDGKPVPLGAALVLLTVRPSGYAVTVNGRSFQTGSARVVADDGPVRRSDVDVVTGRGAGATLRQITRIDGDVLIACVARDGDDRPTEFASRPGSGHTLSVWLRVQPGDPALNPLYGWRMWVTVAVAIFTAGAARDLRVALTPEYGPGPAVAAAVGLVFALVTAVGLACRFGWRTAVSTGVASAAGLVLFNELRAALEPTLGDLGAIGVAGCTAVVACGAVGGLVGRLLPTR